MDEPSQSPWREVASHLLWPAIIVLILWLVIGLGMPWLLSRDEPGTWGDQFGAANAIFSALGIAVLVVTLRLQQVELRHQVEELQKTTAALQEQERHLAQQTFDKQFFQMLEFHHKITDTLKIDGNEGRNAFRVLYIKLSNKQADRPIDLFSEHGPPSAVKIEQRRAQILQAFEVVFAEHEAQLGFYFRNLYHALKLVKCSSMSSDQKDSYAALLRAQLSSYELSLIFYNCLTPRGMKFSDMAAEYDLFQNMTASHLVKRGDTFLASYRIDSDLTLPSTA